MLHKMKRLIILPTVLAAWFQRDIEIPKNWTGKRMVFSLERTHWETRIWVDGQLIGTNLSLSTPHEYDLGTLAPGKHTFPASFRRQKARLFSGFVAMTGQPAQFE